MASAPFSTAARTHSMSPAGASTSGRDAAALDAALPGAEPGDGGDKEGDRTASSVARPAPRSDVLSWHRLRLSRPRPGGGWPPLRTPAAHLPSRRDPRRRRLGRSHRAGGLLEVHAQVERDAADRLRVPTPPGAQDPEEDRPRAKWHDP